MKLKELQAKSEKQLRKLLDEKRVEVRDLEFKVSDGQLKNVRALRVAKKTVARILTLLANPVAAVAEEDED